MRIALLSFHTAANYGAALQSYALQRALTEHGFDNLYLDYQNMSRKHEYDMMFHIVDSLNHKKWLSALAYTLGTPFMELRKYRFDKFYKANLKKTHKMYKSSDEAKEANSLFDKFIVGSDQVWNCVCNGYDTAFLLDFVDDNEKKISYSSSFGMSEIPDEYLDCYKKYLSEIKHISTREIFGVKLIKQLIGRDAKLVMDPVFLLTKESWLKMTEPIKEPFVFSYTNKDNQFEAFINQIGYDMKGMKHYKLARATGIGDFISSKVKVKYSMSPTDFLSVINSAELVFTASFHCTAMSIIFNRPFVVTLIGDSGKDERLLTLLKRFGLENRILSDGMTVHDAKSPIDWNIVNSRIEELRKESLGYLIESINN